MSNSTDSAPRTAGTSAQLPSVEHDLDEATEPVGEDCPPPDDDGAAAEGVELEAAPRTEVSVDLPDDATDEEAAAIAAAVQAHLDAERRAADEAEDETCDEWTLSARLLEVGRPTDAIPSDVPVDPWVAAGRLQ